MYECRGVLKKREFDSPQLYPKWVQVELESKDGKKYATDCANVKGLLQIIQSIPSPKAEPFKQWLAQVGYERMLEIENPELAQERMKTLYEQKGYPKDWIDKRTLRVSVVYSVEVVEVDRDIRHVTADTVNLSIEFSSVFIRICVIFKLHLQYESKGSNNIQALL